MLRRIVNVIQIREASTKPNSIIKPFIVNRNPRNLEQLRLLRKPTGYGVDKKDTEFWNKLEVFSTKDNVTAQLVHNTNEVIIQASTKEWAIRKFLYSGKDKVAHITLAKVFAERCLECGIHCFKCEVVDNQNTNLSAFVNTLKEEGIVLEELPYYNIYDIWQRKRQKKPWTVL